MFPIECKDNLPIDHIVITSISIRGALGPITIWVTDDHVDLNDKGEVTEFINFCARRPSTKWKLIYEEYHQPSIDKFKKLDISSRPIKLKPNQIRGIYIHSSRPDDQAIVYDNHSRMRRGSVDDCVLRILPGMAHVSTEPFGNIPIWGWGERAWRLHRKFVGCLEYGIVYRLWNPQEHLAFGHQFQGLALTLFACQRRWESPMSRLPDECIHYILNMMRWDWVNDSAKDMVKYASYRKKKEKRGLIMAGGGDELDDDKDCNRKVSGW
eukprot:CAMPEP_0172481346 /NCGR_PEP_ID=MMETSP1066-20121228/7107_1 /TAXON_ID=671091 /ORGANISM="Coscinodiscus wailesii, Strain CCMP2513" /LENGTH=266 /DNA_ID=CAMNT_0013243511 /DNA_START=59 /DNA_END=856 /DNA_ORIENTATION=-